MGVGADKKKPAKAKACIFAMHFCARPSEKHFAAHGLNHISTDTHINHSVILA